MTERMQRVHVIGSGPNGMAAAITMARAGRKVDVYEAEARAAACMECAATMRRGRLSWIQQAESIAMGPAMAEPS